MKLTQKVDHFTVLRTSIALVAAHRISRQITSKKLAGWMCEVRSIRDVFIGWVAGMDWREKVTVQNCGRALVKPKNQPAGVVLAP